MTGHWELIVIVVIVVLIFGGIMRPPPATGAVRVDSGESESVKRRDLP